MERSPNSDPLVPLTYATPRILLQGQYQCRNWRQLYGSIVLLAFAAAMGFAVFHWRSEISSAPKDVFIFPPLVICSLMPMLCLAAGVHGIWRYCQGKEWCVLITEDGITRAGRFWKWEDVGLFSASHSVGGVTIEFYLSATNPFSGRMLELCPPLSADQYSALARVLMLHVVPRHRHLKVIPEAQHSGS